MQAFVTGATGFIGNGVALALRRAGYRVHGLARSADKARALAAAEITPVLGDLGDPASYRPAAAASDLLVHCAMEYGPAGFDRDLSAVETLLAAARERAPRPTTFLYTSGIWVYGSQAGRVIDEHTPATPLPMVARRVEHERLVLAASDGACRTLVLRPGCVYGHGGSLTALWFGSAAAGEVEAVGDGSNRWAMVHVDDLGSAYVAAARSEAGGRALPVADGSRHSIDELTAAVASAAGVAGRRRFLAADDARAKYGPLADGLLADCATDASGVERLLGWTPRHRSFAAEADVYLAAWQAAQAG